MRLSIFHQRYVQYLANVFPNFTAMPNIDDFSGDAGSIEAIVKAFYVGSLSDLETIDDDAPTVPGIPPSFEEGEYDLPLPFVEIEIFEILKDQHG